ncbi:fluoride efflux transporter FluC [Halorubrum ezzemoulense]|uniref:Fluoride-specific ion channel FluC n=2 Tax=Halorubrum ezzemoulense TaxID=337243 RepID=A0A1X4H8T9_HALEZ|nr:CrcB family protein [Halorubrum ezzemoulense]MDB9252790.1 CrcB family protein [Halorubrum ezzemoulense]MDB9256827.1 CrcB family protein [Halorubrum ezzemoulense]MDB9277135.1 CrcB family protein [Halorubrum ezzemoulense]OSP07803.1 chromosome condensation protein CrcB [Halorubrum ezzemoulense DSM 17463]OYR74524.1 CrcB family protein [Halorubrum ezzemoulense]
MDRTPYGFLLVAAGGFLGAVARHAVDAGVAGVLTVAPSGDRLIALGGVPPGAGTLVANVVGSFALGLLLTRASSDRVRLLVGTGALSSFTTYSTFVADAVALGTTAGAGYVAGSYAAGFAAAALGLAVGRRRR